MNIILIILIGLVFLSTSFCCQPNLNKQFNSDELKVYQARFKHIAKKNAVEMRNYREIFKNMTAWMRKRF